MSEKSVTIDQMNARLLKALQKEPTLSQRELAERVGLSQNACWRRLKRLQDSGIIKGMRLVLDREALGLSLVVFVMIRTRQHSAEWLAAFRQHIATVDEVIDFHRIGGDYDYLLRIVTRDMASYDKVYQRLIEKFELNTVTSYFAMEAIMEERPLAIVPE